MSHDQHAASNTPRFSRPRFFVLVLLSMAVLALVAAHMPSRVKLLGLFPAVVGVIAGSGIAFLATQHGRSRRLAMGTAVTIVPLVLAGYAGESFRSWAGIRRAEMTAHLLAQPGGRGVLDRLHSGVPAANAGEAQFLDTYRKRLYPPVTAYLVERLKGLPFPVTMPWAAVVAAVELLLGCAVGIVAAAVVSRPAKPEASA